MSSITLVVLPFEEVAFQPLLQIILLLLTGDRQEKGDDGSDQERKIPEEYTSQRFFTNLQPLR